MPENQEINANGNGASKVLFIVLSVTLCLILILTANNEISLKRKLFIIASWVMGASSIYGYVFDGKILLPSSILNEDDSGLMRLFGLAMGVLFIICSLNFAYRLWN